MFRSFIRRDEHDTNTNTMGEWCMDNDILEKLHVCIAKAAFESLSMSEYNKQCATLLSSASIHSSRNSSSSSASTSFPALNCVHVQALESVLTLDDRCVLQATENLAKIPLPVGTKSYVKHMLSTSRKDLNDTESQYVIAAASLRPSGGAPVGAEEELVDDQWPLLNSSAKRKSEVDNLVPQIWRIDFERESGDPSQVYSIVAPGN